MKSTEYRVIDEGTADASEDENGRADARADASEDENGGEDNIEPCFLLLTGAQVGGIIHENGRFLPAHLFLCPSTYPWAWFFVAVIPYVSNVCQQVFIGFFLSCLHFLSSP